MMRHSFLGYSSYLGNYCDAVKVLFTEKTRTTIFFCMPMLYVAPFGGKKPAYLPGNNSLFCLPLTFDSIYRLKK